MKERDNIRKQRYQEVSPSAAVMIPLTVGVGLLILSTIFIFTSIFQPDAIEIPSWGFLFLLLISIFGLYGLYDARKEYRYQKEHNIKWK